jgi:hypothetical protein
MGDEPISNYHTQPKHHRPAVRFPYPGDNCFDLSGHYRKVVLISRSANSVVPTKEKTIMASTPATPTRDLTFNQFLRVHDLQVNEENLQLLADRLGRPASKTSRVPLDRIAELEVVFSSNGSAPEAPKPKRSSVKSCTLDRLMGEYGAQGLTGIKPSYLRMAYPTLFTGAKTQTDLPLTSEWEELIRHDFTVLLAVLKKLQEDEAALAAWTAPNPDILVTQGALYSYMGVCGHTVQASRERVYKRQQGHNAKVSPFPRLCPMCLAKRLELFSMLSFAAGPDQLCRVCAKPMFIKGKEGHIDSRGDIYENLLSKVTPVVHLLWRLVPQHSDSHRDHVARRREFEEWERRYRLLVAGEISQDPAKAEELKAGLENRIAEKQIELGLLSY